MKVAFRKSFERDLRTLRSNPRLLARIREIIEAIEAAPTLQSVPGLSGTPNYYRIRMGDYQIGLALEDDTIAFVRCLHRKDIYRYFP